MCHLSYVPWCLVLSDEPNDRQHEGLDGVSAR